MLPIKEKIFFLNALRFITSTDILLPISNYFTYYLLSKYEIILSIISYMRKIFNPEPILGMQSCINFDEFAQAVPLGLIGEPI